MRKPWTSAEDRKLRRLYASLSASECAAQLDRTTSAVQQRVNVLGLHKPLEWVAERARQRWAEGRHENSRAGLVGGRGWNKGVKGSPRTHPNCRKTQFRKGHIGGMAAARIQPVGALRIADGQLQKKVNNDRPFMRRWVAVSRLVWESANGAIPSGHAVTFKPGLQTVVESEITLDRLELVSRAELMRRNSYHTRYPKEVAQLIQLKGAINRKINRRSKQA